MASRVFITQQQPGFDYSSAEDFGKVVSIWPSNVQAWGDTRHLAADARRILADFDHEQDYLLPMGDPALMCMASAEVSIGTDGTFNVLKWDRRKGKTGGYRVVEIDLDGQPV